ncbi:adenine phosphoribosyltransferase [Longispora fulva]|uniref:Adenine phosphoribosyltransferase n=1 Tax=Longispora fulva TaxID=619741 RepID=A0A8J7GEP4_9ACTN|nr:phosphoribosyltransferase [Longispora fulva]MBG6139248.1 adenine phosphoribosyltransferase [Longispora fulva]GIG58742.1 adenine phosphoribosyltransferase [Longispora fulva]
MTEAIRRVLKERAVFVGDGFLHLRALWRDPEILSALGPALAALHEGRPTVVAGNQSSGYLLGPLVAAHLGLGFLALRKAPAEVVSALNTARISEYEVLALDPEALTPTDRVLLVDDLVETGTQARAARTLVEGAGATWLGVAAVTAYEEYPELGVRALIRWEELR